MNNDKDTRGLIFNIQTYSIHDGPGIRTTVFVMGCPLRCIWCQNPESQQFQPQLFYDSEKCTGCGNCVKACPNGAIEQYEGKSRTNRDICTGKGKCVEVCPNEARNLIGRYESAGEVFQEVIDDYPDSEWADPARYQLAIAAAKMSPGSGYDSTSIKEATARLDEFLKSHPEAQISESAEKQLNELREKEAKKNFDIAEFYERQKKINAAVLYYNVVIENYPDTTYAESARKKVGELKTEDE